MILPFTATALFAASLLSTWLLLAPQPSSNSSSSTGRWETFAFSGRVPRGVWSKYDWRKLTTLCLVGFHDDDLTRFAQSRGVRVVSISNIEKSRLPDAGYRASWIRDVVDDVAARGLNGTNLDFEEDVGRGSAEAEGYTALVRDLAARLHDTVPGSRLSVDVAWSPDCIDGRCYDYAELGKHADSLFVMAYDEQSQIWDEPCSARANSPIQQTVEGLEGYLKLGIEPTKLLLGLPWYGYHYPCETLDSDLCLIEPIPFRGCNCSDAAGREWGFGQIVQTLNQWKSVRKWDAAAESPYFNYGPLGGKMYQVRYDDPESLRRKYAAAKAMGLAGVGMWSAQALDYGNDTQVAAMWGALP